MASVALYTPEILALATGLADHAWDETMPLKAGARSRSCGSTLELGLSTDAQGRIDGVALKSQACAIGQAAAAEAQAPSNEDPDRQAGPWVLL